MILKNFKASRIIVNKFFHKIWDYLKVIWTWLDNEHDPLEIILILVTIATAYSLLMKTQEQVEISANTFKSQEKFAKIEARSFINLESFNFVIESNKTAHFSFQIKNFGKTPARRLLMYPAITYPYRIEEQQTLLDSMANIIKDAIQRQDTVGFVLASNSPMGKDIFGPDIITKSDSVLIAKKEKFITAMCLVKYVDIYNEPHYTWFCLHMFTDKSVSAYYKYNDAN